MSRRAARVLVVVVLSLAAGWAEPVRIDFEAGLPEGAQAKGEVGLTRELAGGGQQALRVGRGAELTLPVADRDGYGTISLSVYDAHRKLEGEAARQRLFGPLWGISNRAAQRLVFGLLYAPYLDGNASYGWISTAAGDWASRRYARAPRQAGWRRWVITVTNETDLKVTVDGRPATGFDPMVSRFHQGFNAVYLRGALDLDEPLLVDDLEVAWQPEPLAPRTRPLPGEP
ncbi:MAG: hypothetical protein HUU35_20130, partial [Armatimonadetes bacterium]|nr:hypothetical protein [Armatimonadota bacterium]